MEPDSSSFLARNDFLLRRLFSICGLVPVGAYMVIHLVTNASLLAGEATYQRSVYQIHSFGPLLPVIEWVFIFIPIIFHAVLGVVIVRGGMPNTGAYPYASNIRYTLQRATGLIAFIFILGHVLHMHGWVHFDAWLDVLQSVGGARFRPYNAGSTVATAFQGSLVVTVLYGVGVLACVYHLSNGIWSFGVRWGIWTSPAAMRRAAQGCAAFGVILGVVSIAALVAPFRIDPVKAADVEDSMYDARVANHEIEPNDHKRSVRAGGRAAKDAKSSSPDAANRSDQLISSP